MTAEVIKIIEVEEIRDTYKVEYSAERCCGELVICIDKVNGIEACNLKANFIKDMSMLIEFHEANISIWNEEYKAEQRGDEMRGN